MNDTRDEASSDTLVASTGPTEAIEPLPVADAARYEVEREHARGGLGRIVEVFDRNLGRRIAVKELLHRDGDTTRFLREARITARLQHPSIVPVYELARWPTGEPFYAMKLVRGRSLDRVIAETHGLRERVALLPNLIAVADAIAYAHGERILHRDLKPANVLIGSFGEAVVIDWGLAKDLGAVEGAPPVDEPAVPLTGSDPGDTVEGTVFGTPSYMPPEQARGDAVDERADVYALGAMLYELLSGVPPYGGSSDEALRAVLAEAPPPLEEREPGVPRELAAIVAQAMARDAGARYPSARGMADDLRRFQTGQLVSAHRYSPWTLARRWARRRRVPIALVIAGVAGLAGAALWARHQTERQVDALVADARVAIADGRRLSDETDALRARAFAAFDTQHDSDGERAWQEARARAVASGQRLLAASRALESALAVDGRRRDVRAQIADVLYARMAAAERDLQPAAVDELKQRLAIYDDGGTHLARWDAPAELTIRSAPVARVAVARYEHDATGHLTLGPERDVGATPIAGLALAPASYRLTLRAPGRADTRLPLVVRRGERLSLDVPTVPTARVPAGFLYVPPGRFLLGSATEDLRSFLYAVPLHERSMGAYLIARRKVTWRDWIAYLDALPADERARRRPGTEMFAMVGGVQLDHDAQGAWRITLHVVADTYVARAGEPLRFSHRRQRAEVDWLETPVVGVSLRDGEAYARWLDATGRVPHARVCTEDEWEHAVRGADGRLYPTGETLAPDDANFDETYARAALAFGPDVVGAHPGSVTPFGLDDGVGNALDLTRSSRPDAECVGRGGSFYDARIATRADNRQPAPADVRDVRGGLRLCADVAP